MYSAESVWFLVLFVSDIISEKLKNRGGNIGYLPQVNKFDSRFPISVYDVILSGFIDQKNWFRRVSKQDKEKVDAIIDELGIRKIAKKSIGYAKKRIAFRRWLK